MGLMSANAQSKVINLTTNVTSLVIYLVHGQVVIPLGIAAAACNMAGGYIGSGLAIKKNPAFIRVMLTVVCGLLLVKLGYDVLF